MVDAHHQLSSPRVAEKVAMTMADLAVGHERQAEREGWEEVRGTAQDQRLEVVAGLVDSRRDPAARGPAAALRPLDRAVPAGDVERGRRPAPERR